MDLSHNWWIVIRDPEDWFPKFITRFNHSSFEVDRVSWETRGSPESGVALATSRLDRCIDFDGARVVVESEVSILSGLARLLWEGIPPVKGALLIQVDKGRFVAGALLGVPQMAILQGGSPMGIEQYLLTSDQPTGEIKEDVVQRLEKPKLALALQHYGREKPNWGSLFKVYELLRGQHTDEVLEGGRATNSRRRSRWDLSGRMVPRGPLSVLRVLIPPGRDAQLALRPSAHMGGEKPEHPLHPRVCK